MIKNTKVLAVAIILSIILTATGCKKADPKETYEKENAGSTGYGATVKSAMYIDDFYFLTIGTVKSKVDLLVGSAHYCENNNELMPVYNLQNGDSISIKYDEREKDIKEVKYTYSDGKSENFFDILKSLGIISYQNSSGETTVVPGIESNNPDDNPDNTNDQPQQNDSQDNTTIPEKEHHTAVQGDYFASGMYNYTLIEPMLVSNMQRSNILATVGKPNYYYSHTFTDNSYIIDCYNLNDGSKLYLDYGYQRENLRCAAIYKNGVYTSVLGKWNAQELPEGFTRMGVNRSKITSLSKNMTPIMVYKKLGEPSWYEGTRGLYSDVYVLIDGSLAYLSFGSAHNKLTSVSIKGADGTETVVTIK